MGLSNAAKSFRRESLDSSLSSRASLSSSSPMVGPRMNRKMASENMGWTTELGPSHDCTVRGDESLI